MECDLYMGIDPGKSGAIVLLDQQGKFVHASVIPCVGKEYDFQEIFSILTYWKPRILRSVLEDVHSIHGASANSNFQFGLGKGMLMGALSGLNIPHSMVAPKTWQKIMHQGLTQIKDPKEQSMIAALRLFEKKDLLLPDSKRAKVAHSGIVDASLMAEYCRRTYATQ